MTILIQVVKENLISALNEQIESLNSKAKSKEETSWPSSFFPMSYNIELAKSKSFILKGLRKFINTMDEKETDLATIKNLCTYIRAYKQRIELESQKHNYSPGTTEAMLERLVRFSDTFYQKGNELRLLDIANTNGAFAHFTKAVSLYHARRIMDDCRPKVLQGLFENPRVSSINAFHQAVDASVNTIFLFACQNLDAQKILDEEAAIANKNAMGSFCVQYLIYEHEKLYGDYTVMGFRMLPNYLKDYLVAAQTAVIDDQKTNNTLLFTDEDLGNYDTILDLNLNEDQKTGAFIEEAEESFNCG